MQKPLRIVCLLAFLAGMAGWLPLKGQSGFHDYLKPAEINARLEGLQAKYPSQVKVKQLAVSPGGIPVNMLEIGPSGGDRPAVLVVANAEGTYPIASLGALYLADRILAEPDKYSELNWYIVPCLNPDGALRYFSVPLYMDGRNARKVNEDLDDQMDEDGYNDLNGDGYITRMRVRHPEGEWVPVESDPRMMKRADPAKGEKGIYKLYTEGVDDDGDGKYNEDLPGGVDPSINFPHLFKPFTATGGKWPGEIDETFRLMKFVYEHPEIAMGFYFGSSDFCYAPPRTGRRGSVDMNRIKIPPRQARRLNVDPDKTYTMEEIKELLQPMIPRGMEISESMIAGFLGLGAVVNPLEEDMKFYRHLSEEYKEFLKEKGYEGERLEAPQDRDGSFELWMYYHVGVPSFSMNLFTLPKPEEKNKDREALSPEKIEKMTKEEFLALGEEKIEKWLREAGAPSQFKGSRVMEMVESGQLIPERIVSMMKQQGGTEKKDDGDVSIKALLAFSDRELEGKGFVKWEPYQHPDLGEVEIGGAVPFTENTPPASMIDSLLELQVPWVFELAEKLPRLSIREVKTTDLGDGVYRLEVWIENGKYLPFPTAMGERNQQPAPAVVLLEGENLEFLQGLPRTPVQKVGGMKVHREEWLIRSASPQTLTLRLTSKNAWGDVKTIKIGG